ncbi:MAG: heme biosynthesis protein HemY, partial [Gammaproteobacteria bacterium]|nr:heme biosynthesis protein HemY [Gammaproteobacteria bacterium]
MIRFIVLLIVGLGAGAVLAFLVVRDPGYVLVSYDGSTMETSLWFALACLFLVALFVYLLGFLIRRLARSGFAVSGWFRWRRATKARNRSLTGIMLLAEGRWSEAKRALLESADRIDTPLANLLAAARSANELGDYRERDDILALARESTPQADFVVELVRAELQQVAGQWARSIATLNALREKAPQHPMVLKRLLDAHENLGDFDAVAELAPSLPKDAAPDMVAVEAAIW